MLAIDNDPVVTDLYRDILAPSAPSPKGFRFELHTTSEGDRGVALVRRAVEQREPFAVTFINHMPPIQDGIETASQIRQLDPQIYIVIVSAQLNQRPLTLQHEPDERLYYLQKPFMPEELKQMVYSTSACVSRSQDTQQLHNLFRSTTHTMRNSISYLDGMAEHVYSIHDNPKALSNLLNSERMDLIQEQISEIGMLIEILLESTQAHAYHQGFLPLREKIEKSIALFSATSEGRGIRVATDLEQIPENCCIHARPIDGQTLFLNLLNNAADAANDHLKRQIGEAPAEKLEQIAALQSQPLIRIGAQLHEGGVTIRVSNLGDPIPTELLKRIFDPGFSLKRKGNGIGLHDAREIVEQIGGSIAAENGEQMVTLTLKLPYTPCNRRKPHETE